MPSHLLAAVASLGSVLPGQPAASPPPSRGDLAAPAGDTGGAIRTDRLSAKQLDTWSQIVEIVMAEDDEGRSLHPTLRGLWDAVDSSGHTVQVELIRSKQSYVAGRFEVTRVDPSGAAHEGRLILNLWAIDRVSTHPVAARADGFIPFEGLGKKERYAELLGHELAHAAWHLADVERARLAQRLQSETERHMQLLLAASSEEVREALMEQAEEFDRLGRMLEEPAESAEIEIWKELTGQRR